jgi:hypothetical protein
LGNIHDPTRIIIHNDYFQNLRYINSHNLATLWRHIFNIDNLDGTGLFDKHANPASGINWLTNRSDFISVHIRLGDYTQSAIHNIDFSAQIKKITGEILMADSATRFIFLTDDVDTLSNNIANYINIVDYPDRYVIINEPDPLNSLKLMASCQKGHILSNSSFSLWGAILNPNPDKLVYLPRRWLNSDEGADITESFKDICRYAVFF